MDQRGWRLLRRVVIRAAEDHAAVDVAAMLNLVFDVIPRVEVRWSGRPQPAFRTCGTVGFGAAVVVAVSAAWLGGRSMPALAQAIGVAVLSFFAWALLRRAITGVERLVLLEHVWIALLSVAITLRVQGLPVAATLDPFCAGLAFFLAGGRAGCTLVGCCHGHPSTIGMRYPRGHAKEGFPDYLVGIRLFPVQLLEFAGLLMIGVTTFMIVPFAAAGCALLWYLFSYALLRFALEELRADERPHFLSMSVPRWMCLGEFAFTLALTQPAGWIPIVAVAGALAWHLGRDGDRHLLSPGHVKELRSLVETFRTLEGGADGPRAWSTSRCVTLAISDDGSDNDHRTLHLSLCLPSRHENLRLACQLAAEAFPRLDPDRAVFGGSNTLHFLLPGRSAAAAANPRRVFQRLYRGLLIGEVPEAIAAPPAASSPPLIPWYWRVSN
jgi:hypothetical protein